MNTENIMLIIHLWINSLVWSEIQQLLVFISIFLKSYIFMSYIIMSNIMLQSPTYYICVNMYG